MPEQEPKANAETSIDVDQPGTVSAAINLALSKLKATTDLEELERVLSAVRAGSEIQKLNAERVKAERDAVKSAIDTELAPKQLRYSFITSMFSPLVPIASLMTVIVSLFISREQLQQSAIQNAQHIAEERSARDEASWRSFEDEIDKSTPDKLYSNPTFLSRLRDFSGSGGHVEQVSDISKQLMIGLTSASAFQDLWKLEFKNVTADNVDKVIEMARAEKLRYDQAVNDCGKIKTTDVSVRNDVSFGYMGLCSPTYTDDELVKTVTDNAVLRSLLAARVNIANITSNQILLSNVISAYMREHFDKNGGAKELDLSNVLFLDADLSDIDFSKVVLTQVAFGRVIFSGAILTSKTITNDFRWSTWWDAAAISQVVLPDLIRFAYPERPGMLYPASYKISFDDYVEKVANLCTSKLKVCSKTCLPFGDKDQVPLECSSSN
jgi:uncharacterized protein YjbI with pentapeptide repeats